MGKKVTAKSSNSRLDILFAGPVLLVPDVKENIVAGVEVFFPVNDHPIGAVFMPAQHFSDAELEDPQCERWPGPETFSLLDPHSYQVEITQKPGGKKQRLAAARLPEKNHLVRPKRRLSSDWTLAVAVSGQMSGWTSHRYSPVTHGQYLGADVPKVDTTAAMHRLTFDGVIAADFHGASAEARSYLRENIRQGGTLIVVGEVPYQPSLRHERKAIDALARLAGLDLHLAETAPAAYKTRLAHHTTNCGLSVIMTD